MKRPRHRTDVSRWWPRWWWVWTLAGLLVGAAAGGLLAGLPQLARAELSARLDAVAQRTGASIRIEALHVGLLGTIRLDGLRVSGPPGAGVEVAVRSVSTRLRLEALLAGRKRLSQVRVEGVEVAVDALPEEPEAALRELERRARVLRRSSREPAAGEGGGGGLEGLDVTVLGGEVRVGERVVLRDLRGSLERPEEGGLRARVEGRHGEVALLATAVHRDGAVSGEARFEPPLAVPGAPASVGGVRLDADGTVSLAGLRAGPVERHGVRVQATCDRVVLRRGEHGGVAEVVAPVVTATLPVGRDGLADWARDLAGRIRGRASGGGAGGSAAGAGEDDRVAALVAAPPMAVRVVDGRVLATGPRGEAIARAEGLAATLGGGGETSGAATVIVDGLPPLPTSWSATLDGLAPRVARVSVQGAPLGEALRDRAGLSAFTGEGTADVEVRWERGWALPKGAVTVHGLTIANRRISPLPVVLDGLTVAAEVERDEAKGTGALTLDLRAGTGAHARVVLRGRGLRKKPLYELVVDIPKQDCAKVVDAVPRGMLPSIGEDLRVEGTLEGHVELLDLDPGYFPKLRLVTEGGWDDCRIVRLPKDVEKRLQRIAKPFKLEVDEGEGPIGVFVGPKVPGYVPLGAMPPLLRSGPLLTEDGAHYVHKGFSRHALEGALRLDLTKRRYVYGGSSISQQLVKNLFLHRNKTLSRKLEEAVIVVAMERTISKDRILELYHNCIEYGAKLYGIGNAARHYFGKGVAQLAPVEIAFLMHLKTSPKEAFWLAGKGSLPQRWRDAIAYRMRNFVKKGYISQEVYDASAPFDPIAVRYPAPAPEAPAAAP